MKIDLVSGLTIAATAATGLLAGASLDQSIKQLPARRRIGNIAYSKYSRAADLRNGVPFYSALGIGAATLCIAAAVCADRIEPKSPRTRPLKVASGLAVLHSLVTLRAAPANFSQRRVAKDDEKALWQVFDRFERWQGVRSALQVLNLGALLCAIADSVGKSMWSPMIATQNKKGSR